MFEKDLENVGDIIVSYKKYKTLNRMLLENICDIMNKFLGIEDEDIGIKGVKIDYSNPYNEIYGGSNESNRKKSFNGAISFNNIEFCYFYFTYNSKEILKDLIIYINTNTEFKITKSK